jgi:hypothetical protein
MTSRPTRPSVLLFLSTMLFIFMGCGQSPESSTAAVQTQDATLDAIEELDANVDSETPPDASTQDSAQDGTQDSAQDGTQDSAQDGTQDSAQDGTQDSAQDVLDVEVVNEDTGPEDATPLSSVLALACDDFFASVYLTPESALEPDVPLGTISTCASDSTWSQALMVQSLSAVGASPTYGVQELRVSYRTERGSGAAGASTAFILLPEPRPTEPMDTIVWAHGTTGLADLCAPSNYPGYYGYLPYVYAAQGYAVIGPDYAGLGNEGIQGYGDGRDTAYSLLDAPAALSEVLGPEMLTGDVVMVGYSQGGGAVLNAQALESEHPVSGELVGVIDFAGTIAITDEVDPNLWSYWNMVPANYAQGTSGGFGALYVYAHLANTLGEDQADLFFGEDWKEIVSGWIETVCIGELITNFSQIPPTVMFDDIYDPSFPAGVLACITDSNDCEEPYAAYASALETNMFPLDPDGGRVLVVAGALDTITQPQDVSCVVDKMAQWGITADLCVDPMATHSTVVDTHIDDALAWTAAVLNDEPAPACSTAGALPLCP